MILISENTNIQKITEMDLYTLKSILQSKKQFNAMLNSNIEIILNAISSSNNNIDNQHLHKILSNLSNSITDINNTISSLEKLLNLLTNFINSNYNLDSFDIENYNSLYETTIKNSLDIDIKTTAFLDDLHSFMKNTFTSKHITSNESNVSNNSTYSNHKPQTSKETEKLIIPENTLLISELKNKVYLPYTKDDLNKLIQKNDKANCSVNDIIEANYTVPLASFKNLSVSRFREAFKLMRNIEKSSLKQAFDLGLEVFFNHNLHPAIILGCRNLNELDIYLDCLETNETHKFNCFSIIFEIAPVLKTKFAFSGGKHK